MYLESIIFWNAFRLKFSYFLGLIYLICWHYSLKSSLVLSKKLFLHGFSFVSVYLCTFSVIDILFCIIFVLISKSKSFGRGTAIIVMLYKKFFQNEIYIFSFLYLHYVLECWWIWYVLTSSYNWGSVLGLGRSVHIIVSSHSVYSCIVEDINIGTFKSR